VRVRRGESVASYTGPESCACGREAASEALIGECVRPGIGGVGQVWGADVFRPTEGEMVRVVTARYEPASLLPALGVPVRPRQRIDFGNDLGACA
jgi:hypothetical protein